MEKSTVRTVRREVRHRRQSRVKHESGEKPRKRRVKGRGRN